MSECVVRMEMPKACWSCGLRFVCKAANDFLTTKEAGCSVLKVGMPGCLIICQLPEGHGDLIDRDSMVEEWVDEKIGNPHADYEADDVIYDLKKRTVIVPKDKAYEP